MPPPETTSSRTVTASVDHILPLFGLAYALDDEQVSWGITRSTDGPGLSLLKPGQAVRLHVHSHDGLDLVSRYELAR